MIKVKISNFIKKNKNKINDLLIKLIMVAIVIFVATIILSFNKSSIDSKDSEKTEIYKPKETIIKGSDVSEEQYKKDSNIVDKFLEYCNNGKIIEAYGLLTDDCKKELYPTLEKFKNNYYNTIFAEKREYNLQSWITTSKYTVYKIRYTNNILSTGTYEEDNVYEDYITLNKEKNIEKISIGKLVACEDCNVSTQTNEFEVTVTTKKIYISEEEYEIKIKNNTDKTILLDPLKTSQTINLIGNSGTKYGAYTNEIFLINLTINPGVTKTITIRFKKNFSSNNKSEKIEFSNVIRDYYAYIQNQENYNDITSIKAKLED